MIQLNPLTTRMCGRWQEGKETCGVGNGLVDRERVDVVIDDVDKIPARNGPTTPQTQTRTRNQPTQQPELYSNTCKLNTK